MKFSVSGLSSCKCIVAGDCGEVACIVQGEDADVAEAADFEAVDAAVGRDDPGGLFCVAPNGTDEK